MKKLFLLYIAFVTTSVASAQFSVKLDGGLNSNFRTSKDLNDSIKKLYSKTSPSLGIGVGYRINKFQFEITGSYLTWGWRQKGVNFTDASGNDLGTGDISINNKSVLTNLSIGYCIGKRFEVMPQISFGSLLSFSEKYEIADINFPTVQGGTESNQFENSIWMIGGGIVFTYKLSPHFHLFNQEQYQRSISGVSENNSNDLALNNFRASCGLVYIFKPTHEK